jgi:hypothetical protein
VLPPEFFAGCRLVFVELTGWGGQGSMRKKEGPVVSRSL